MNAYGKLLPGILRSRSNAMNMATVNVARYTYVLRNSNVSLRNPQSKTLVAKPLYFFSVSAEYPSFDYYMMDKSKVNKATQTDNRDVDASLAYSTCEINNQGIPDNQGPFYQPFPPNASSGSHGFFINYPMKTEPGLENYSSFPDVSSVKQEPEDTYENSSFNKAVSKPISGIKETCKNDILPAGRYIKQYTAPPPYVRKTRKRNNKSNNHKINEPTPSKTEPPHAQQSTGSSPDTPVMDPSAITIIDLDDFEIINQVIANDLKDDVADEVVYNILNPTCPVLVD